MMQALAGKCRQNFKSLKCFLTFQGCKSSCFTNYAHKYDPKRCRKYNFYMVYL